MGRQVYDYKTGSMLFKVLFPFVWSGFFFWQCRSVAMTSGNEVLSFIAPMLTYGAGLLGLGAIAVGCGFFLRLLRERIVIEDGKVTYTDWRGGKVQCPLSDVIGLGLVEDTNRLIYSSSKDQRQIQKVITKAGTFGFTADIRGYQELLDKLNAGAAEHSAEKLANAALQSATR